MAQEEKLAHDLHAVFTAHYDAVTFDRIAVAESGRLTAVRTLLRRYGVTDPTADQPAGKFTDPAVPPTYDELLTQGRQNLSAALAAGQQVERTDIADLKAALNGLTARTSNRSTTICSRHPSGTSPPSPAGAPVEPDVRGTG